jgi:hypothetical protein
VYAQVDIPDTAGQREGQNQTGTASGTNPQEQEIRDFIKGEYDYQNELLKQLIDRCRTKI